MVWLMRCILASCQAHRSKQWFLNNYSVLRALFSQPMLLCDGSHRNCGMILSHVAFVRLSMFGREQKLARRIVRPVAPQGQVAILHGIAVDAAMRTGIVLANIPRSETAALFAVALLARLAHDRLPGNALKPVGIHAARLFDQARNEQGLLGADAQLHSMRVGNMCQFGGEFAHLIPCHGLVFAPLEAEFV